MSLTNQIQCFWCIVLVKQALECRRTCNGSAAGKVLQFWAVCICGGSGPNAFSPHLAWVDLGPEHLLISLLPPRPSTQSFFSSFDILYIAKLAEGSQNGRYREDDLSSWISSQANFIFGSDKLHVRIYVKNIQEKSNSLSSCWKFVEKHWEETWRSCRVTLACQTSWKPCALWNILEQDTRIVEYSGARYTHFGIFLSRIHALCNIL